MPFLAYKITHLESGKAYIGITTRTLAHRWSRHVSASKVRASALAGAIIRYGADQFGIEQIASATCKDDLFDLERMLIVQHQTRAPFGYNLTAGGEGAFDPSESTRMKISAIHRGRKCSPDTVEKIRAALLSRAPITDETRERLRANAWSKTAELNRTRVWTEESKEKARVRLLGTRRTEASKAKQAAAMTGRPVSAEAREKIRAKMQARWNDPEKAVKMRMACVGRKLSAETRAKIATSVSRHAAQSKRSANDQLELV